MNENNLSDLFRQIEHTVQDITSLSASELKRTIDDTVREVKNAVSSAATQFSQSPPSASSSQNKTTASSPSSAKSYRAPSYHSAKSKKNQPPISSDLAISPKKVPGRSMGVLLSIVGVSGMILSGIVLLSTLFNHVIYSGSFYSLITPLLVFGASFVVGVKGFSLSGFADRYAKYYRELQGASFCPVNELAKQVSKSPNFVARELKKMIDRKFFLQGHLDKTDSTFILDHETYQHYLQLEARAREEAEKKASNPELDATIREGMVCIQKIREANDAIPGEVISTKLDRLETVITRIFKFMEKHPNRLGEIRRFTSYYLPTTLKLVAAYREFDAQDIQGETVMASKKEIEDALDMINRSFETMYDNLFEQDARDLSADISVLQTMLKQEGLESDGLSGNTGLK